MLDQGVDTPRSPGAYCFTAVPSCANRNAYTSTSSSIRSDSDVSSPWPLLALVRSSTGPSDAACNRAVILRDCIGSTRGSLAPVRNSTAGYFVPSLTWWYGEYAYIALNSFSSL